MKRDILYVDDEPDNIVVFEATFEDHFTVHTAGNGRQALQVLERIHVPVVVADQRMPEMTGVGLFEVMRTKFPHTRRILLTGYSDSDALLNAINKGQIFYFLKKPWQRGELLSVILRAIEAHDLEAENHSLTQRLVLAERCALLGQASARITHEMGNQLSMLPMLEMIQEQYGHDEQLTRMVQFARESYERLAALVQEVKAFVQMDEGVPLRPVSLRETIHELVSFLRFDSTVPAEAIRVEISRDPVVLGSRVKLQQVLVNLIKNAAYAIRECPAGRIVIGVGASEDEALLTVTDNGCGMDAETLSRIWDPFFTTKGKDGTGLGLDISRRIIENHNGTIDCESWPGVGTTFTIRLPVAAAPAEQPALVTS